MLDPGAVRIVERLRAEGYQALLAGGCVRDWLMGRPPHDWDVATDADPAAVARLFPRTYAVGERFGVTVVLLGGGRYEVARFRSDGPYPDGRHPATVDPADPRADAARRDFTINGMFLDPGTGEVIDHVGGRDDLQRRLIRTIGDPEQRFAEDHLRLLRAVRFAARLGFGLEPGTKAAIRAGAEAIASVSPERVGRELTLILTEGGASTGLQLLLETGLLGQVLPEVAAMVDVPQPPEHHPEGELWRHVQLVFEHLSRPGPRLAWAALLHDVGKPRTLTVTDRIRFHNHDQVGAVMAEGICRRLRMANQDTQRIRDLVAQHMRLRHVREMRPGKLKRLLREPWFPELLELHRADCLASHGQLDLYDFCCRQLADAGVQGLRPVRLLTGDDLIALGWEAGPKLGRALEALEDEQLEGRISTREEAERFVDRFRRPVP
ncbi:MAG: CCA tRNA nucleotidyltransferase [Candidatus Latescibacterota bacterium]|jgi:poly(A) polymerase